MSPTAASVLLLAILLVATIFWFHARATALHRAASTAGERRANPDETRRDEDPFAGRRLLTFEREGITIPERSEDSRECDDFARHQPPCSVSDGYAACFECVESRASLRVCTHLAEPLSVHDARTGRTYELPANASSHEGYCLREQVARDLRTTTVDVTDAPLARARRECSVFNADWLLVRRRVGNVDSTFNFVCRCKYPHLMTNIAGPLSACSRDVACNAHGRLDEEARESRSDPFVNGRCLCDDGWLSEYDDAGGVGPYCREATFAEWPSVYFGAKRAASDLELSDEAVDSHFRDSLRFSRRDDPNRQVWLPNPCTGGCELVRSSETGAYFCGDSVELANREDGEKGWRVVGVGIGVRRERDYLEGNGGRLPNACLRLPGESIDQNRVLMQFMSQEWNDGTHYAHEWGVVVTDDTLRRAASSLLLANGGDYARFVNGLTRPKNPNSPVADRDVIWMYNSNEMLEHRVRVSESVHRWLVSGAMWNTDLCYHGIAGENGPIAWHDFPLYNPGIVNSYYLLKREFVDLAKKARQSTYSCPDRRGIDQMDWGSAISWQEIDQGTAERLARSMLPVCLIDHESAELGRYQRPELNVAHDENVTACVLFDAASNSVQYSYSLWHPANMNALRFARSRNVSMVER